MVNDLQHKHFAKTVSLSQIHGITLRPLPRSAPTLDPQGHGEAPLLLHRPDRHGHPERPGQEGDTQWHLQLYYGAVPLLQRQQTGKKKLRIQNRNQVIIKL